MPKIKSHRGLAKRVKRTGSGKLKRSQAFTGHLAHSKSQKQKRQLRKSAMISKGDFKRIKSLLVK